MSRSPIKSRMSINTSLKNARIFDDDSWEAETSGFIQTEDGDEEMSEILTTASIEIKQELFSEDANFVINTEEFNKVKIDKEMFEELTSPKKDAFENSNSSSRHSFKSSKIGISKKRDSPYKLLATERRAAAVVPCPDISSDSKKKKVAPPNYETDDEILKRRQKQIDYGKNTIGYDRYCELVPKTERKPDDPQTPRKHIKYSRRGWDGLVKQWRLKLHKYDTV